MTNQGWQCPVCKRGVSPDEKTCHHGGRTFSQYFSDCLNGNEWRRESEGTEPFPWKAVEIFRPAQPMKYRRYGTIGTQTE